MTTKTLKLISAASYGYKGFTYEPKKLYDIADEAVWSHLLEQRNEAGIPYFREVTKADRQAAQDRAKAKQKEAQALMEADAVPDEVTTIEVV